jgi:transposase-like protein
MEGPATTLQAAIIWLSDFEHCRQFMTELRWPDGVVKCPHCASAKVSWLAKARVWKCYAKHERPTFTLKTGTIFEDSPVPLEKWLIAVWLLISRKNGISSYEIHRCLGVTQKTAWFMLRRIRLAMQDDRRGGKLNGEMEIDATSIGGRARNMYKDRKQRVIQGKTGGAVGEVPVQAMLVRGGRVRVNA